MDGVGRITLTTTTLPCSSSSSSRVRGKSGGGKGSATNSGGSTLNPNLSLLAVHRKRMAPMQAAAAEEATLKAKVEAQLASVREEARVLNDQF